MPGEINAKMRSAFSVLVIGSGLMAVGCRKGGERIWTADAKSPDGQWLARPDAVSTNIELLPIHP
jgi:hypothetical protein